MGTITRLAGILALSVFDYLRETPEDFASIQLAVLGGSNLTQKKHQIKSKILQESIKFALILCKLLMVHCDPPAVHCVRTCITSNSSAPSTPGSDYHQQIVP